MLLLWLNILRPINPNIFSHPENSEPTQGKKT
jgi:hypothetical protein